MEKRADLQLKSFSGGWLTDVSPLVPTGEFTADEENMSLSSNNIRRRRLGVDLEADFVEIETGVSSTTNIAYHSFRWENVGGDPDKAIMVVQVGHEIFFFDMDEEPISSGLIYTHDMSSTYNGNRCSIDSVDGILVLVNGDKNIYTFEYDGTTITAETRKIYVRDFWGVEDVFEGKDLNVGPNIGVRPTSLTDEHLYNLRNQGFGSTRLDEEASDGNLYDPIELFYDNSDLNGQLDDSYYPSNADLVTPYLYANAASSEPLWERYYAREAAQNPPGSTPSPKGYFIIDLLDRGASRLEAEQENFDRNQLLTYQVSNLPVDSSAGGATVIKQFAGRIFYAGFDGTLTGGDAKSPQLSSYVLFSQLVKDYSDITTCYSEADPTSEEDSAIAQTDGGYIRISGAYGIKDLIPSGSSLIVIASNGVWVISGGNDYGFTADNYKVTKISDSGSYSSLSSVFIDGLAVFWGEDSIYSVFRDRYGDWKVEDMLINKLKNNFYNLLSGSVKASVSGAYDKYERKIRWVYNEDDVQKELVYDVDAQAFSKNRFMSDDDGFPKIVATTFTNPYDTILVPEPVTIEGEIVTVDGETVTVEVSERGYPTKEVVYIAVLSDSPVKFSFAKLRNTDFKDWSSVIDGGLDAAAYIVTQPLAIQDYSVRKSLPQVYVFTAEAITDLTYVGGEITLDKESSCLMSARWNWADNSGSNRWSTPRQMHRKSKAPLPDLPDPSGTISFPQNFSVVCARDTIRGSGRTVQLKFETEPNKELILYGVAAQLGASPSDGK